MKITKLQLLTEVMITNNSTKVTNNNNVTNYEKVPPLSSKKLKPVTFLDPVKVAHYSFVTARVY